MKIIFSKKALSIFFRNKRYCCAFFFSLISISFQAQIFQSNNPSLYISEGTIIIEINNEPNIETAKPINGQLHISKNTVIYDNQKNIFGKVVVIEGFKVKTSTKKHLVFIPKLKKLDSGKIAESIKKSDFNFVSGKSNSIFQTDSANGYIAISNTNSQIKAILAKNANFGSKEIVYKTPVDSFIKKENYSNSVVYYFSIRPPPVV
ncbi:hypothetical protein [Chryseobacterium sp. T1]